MIASFSMELLVGSYFHSPTINKYPHHNNEPRLISPTMTLTTSNESTATASDIEEAAPARVALPRPPSSIGENDDIMDVPAASHSSRREGQLLEWRDVSMSIRSKKRTSATTNSDSQVPKKMILDHVWGQARPGETTAILGASGAGKTSLFHVLAGRIVSNRAVSVEGTVRLGGTTIDPSQRSIQKLFAFVAQQDSLNMASTVRESLLFSARLRLPRPTTTTKTNKASQSPATRTTIDNDDEQTVLISDLLDDLGLTSCSDSLVSELSGGERRRTSIGVELISNPTIIFLDEPTSGLDSTSARQVLELLEKVAKHRGNRNTVVFTIHQPSSQIFGTFDRLILLHRGRLMYQGICRQVSDDFASCQYPIPRHYNPADWILDVAQSESIEMLESRGFFPKEPDHEVEKATLRASGGAALTKKKEAKRSAASLMTQQSMLLRREKNSLVRSPAPMIANVTITAVLALIFGVIFFGIGREDRTDLLVVQGQFGAVVNVLMSVMMGQSQTALIVFSSERPVFLREYATNHYTILPYFLSKLVSEALQSFVAMVVLDLIAYFMIGFQMNFFIFFLLCYTLALTTTAVCVLLGSYCTETKTAMALFPLVIVPQFYFSGIFIATNLIPEWVRWIQYLCSLKYAAGLAIIYEFSDCDAADAENCMLIMEQNNVDPDDAWWYWLAMAGLFVIFRISAIFVLRKRGRFFS